jgi:hypothetical protein
MLGLPGVGRLIVNPDRRGRSQLRVIRRRLKEYDLLKKSRSETQAERAAKQEVNDYGLPHVWWARRKAG